MWRIIESWGASHPVLLAVAALILGGVPTGFVSYNAGFYEGVTNSDSNWRANFDQKLKAAVNDKISTECGKITEQLNISCQKAAKSFENAMSSKQQEIGELQSRIEYLNRRSDIMDTYDVLNVSAESILDQLLKARSERNRDSETTARTRFFELLSAIHTTNQIYADWSALFDSKATELVQRNNNKENISTDEIVGYLKGFTSEPELKKKVIQNGVDVANGIRRNKY